MVARGLCIGSDKEVNMKRFKKVLCITDISEECTVAIDQAAQLVEHNQGTLTVATLVKGSIDSLGTDTHSRTVKQNSCSEKIEAKVEAYRNCIDVQLKTLTGKPYLGIIRDVLRNGYDLVIKVQSAAYWKNRLFNRTDMQLLGKCPCPVWLVDANKSKTKQRILAAVDVSETGSPSELRLRMKLNHRILELASAMALFNRSELHVVQAWHLVGESAMRGSFIRTPEEKVLDSLAEKRKRFSANLDRLVNNFFSTLALPQEESDVLIPRVHLVKGWEHKEIPALAKQVEADLVIMGSITRTGIADFTMGNTAKSIFRQLEGSFLLIKQPEFVSPVKLT